VPAVFLLALIGCLVWLTAMAYQKVTASSFFDMKAVEVYGAARASQDDIKRAVQMAATKSGVWNADLGEIRVSVEKLPWVKSAVVSRVLPDGLRVRVKEDMPVAAVRPEQGELFWTDSDAEQLGPVSKDEAKSLVVIKGWDERKADGSQKLNQQRIRIYQKMMDELRISGLDKNISALNLSDLEDAQAVIARNGMSIPVSLGKDDFGKRLNDALKTLDAKDAGQIASLISRGKNVVVIPR
jgi:cell division protein FtsQ